MAQPVRSSPMQRSRFTGWRARLDVGPFSLLLAVAAIPVGTTAAVLGSPVSRAITNVLSGQIIPHLWGAVMLSGGVATLVAVGRASWLGEYVGLRLLAFALVFYSACCYIGLGLGGIVSGSFAGAYALGCWWRSRVLYREAKRSIDGRRGAGGA